MELLPIIYTTLLIFSGLTVVTIIFSYVSYKIRKKAKEEVAAAKAKEEPKAKPPQIKKISSQSKKKVERDISGESEKSTSRSSSSHSEHRKKRSDSSRRVSSSSKSSSDHKKKVPIKPRKNRIEILNKTTRTSEDYPVGNGQRSSNRRFDIHQENKDQPKSTKNLFDNYVEDDDEFRPLR